jgi:hypothetical protein
MNVAWDFDEVTDFHIDAVTGDSPKFVVQFLVKSPQGTLRGTHPMLIPLELMSRFSYAVAESAESVGMNIRVDRG